MTLPYTEAESDAAHRKWKARCGHHSIAAVTGKPLDAVRDSGIKLCGWMNPTMITQCLVALDAGFIHQRLPDYAHPYEAFLGANYDATRILRVQFLGPWMKGPVAGQYRHTHYIAFLAGAIMDPVIDCCLLLSADDWIVWACENYPQVIKQCTGFAFTHYWNLAKADTAQRVPTIPDP